jgi:acetolactate synthase-1/2/3 large subunit
MTNLTTGKAIAKSLMARGVDTIFNMLGAHTYAFTDAVEGESQHINFVTTRHEQGAGHLAYSYAKPTEKNGRLYRCAGPRRVKFSVRVGHC